MKLSSVILALSMTLTLSAQYQAKGWCWYDNQDRGGSQWHLGSVDKRQHFAAGFIVGAGVTELAKLAGAKHPKIWGIVAGFAVGYLKERYDMTRGRGTGEVADALWTGIGGYAGAELFSYRW